MLKIYLIVYNYIILPLLFVGVNILSIFNKKVKLGLLGRKRLIENLFLESAGLNNSKQMIWFHASSMGEFEQAKPIIEELKSLAIYNILVTFFSPSGYENQKNYPHADIITYLPFDNSSIVKNFLSYINPKMFVLMRYDLWPNVILQLKRKKTHLLLVDATLNENSSRNMPGSKGLSKYVYNLFDKIITVTNEDAENFRKYGVPESKLIVAGDTRFDRVFQKSIDAKKKNLLDKSIFGSSKVFIFGSSWQADEDVVFPTVAKLWEYEMNFVMIIVPHEPTIPHLDKIESYFAKIQKTIRFSEMRNYSDEKVIIVDSIGILLSLYNYADFAYVGGSFRQGIHNVLEPAVYGIPVFFGPKIENSQEAQKLVEIGCGIKITNKIDLYKELRMLLSNPNKIEELGEIAENYVKSQIGATKIIIQEIHKYV